MNIYHKMSTYLFRKSRDMFLPREFIICDNLDEFEIFSWKGVVYIFVYKCYVYVLVYF